MGKGKKNKASKQMANSQQLSKKQEMSERNVVQEEGFESDDEKNIGTSSMVKVDIHGSDSEEDNAAAGGGLVSKSADVKDRKNLQQTHAPTNLQKKKNKAASPLTLAGAQYSSPSVPQLSASSNSHHENTMLNYDNLGHIVVRLLPSEYQVERLPDGRFVMAPAAIGYLAQKLGH